MSARGGLGLRLGAGAIAAGVAVGCAPARAPLPVAPPAVRVAVLKMPGRVDVPGIPTAPRRAPATVLDSGLTIRVAHQRDAPVFALALSFNAPLSGDDRLIAEVAARLLGAYLNRHTPTSVRIRTQVDVEGFGLTALAPAAQAKRILVALADGLRGKAFGPDHYRSEAVAVARETVESFRRMLGPKLLYRARYGDDHPWAQDSAELIEALERLGPPDVWRFMRSFAVPKKATLVLAGRMPKSTRRQALASLRGWRGPRRTDKARPVPPVGAGRADRGLRFHVLNYAEEHAELLLMHVGPPPAHADYGPFSALCDALGFTWSGLNGDHRHRRGATYGLRTFIVHRPQLTECFFGGSVRPAEVLRVIDDHRAEIARLRRGRIDPGLVTRVTAVHRARRARVLEAPEVLALWLARRRGGLAELDRPRSVSVPRLKAAAVRYFSLDGWEISIFTSDKDLVERLFSRGRVANYDLRRRP